MSDPPEPNRRWVKVGWVKVGDDPLHYDYRRENDQTETPAMMLYFPARGNRGGRPG